MAKDERLFRGRRTATPMRAATPSAATTAGSAQPGLSPAQKLKLIWRGLDDDDKRAFLASTPPELLSRALADQGVDQSVSAPAAATEPPASTPEPAPPAIGGVLASAEHRQAARRAVEMPARIVYDNDTSTIDAKIVDISDTGARVSLGNSMQVPKFFRLQLDPSSAPLVAEVVWRKLTQIGVRLRR